MKNKNNWTWFKYKQIAGCLLFAAAFLQLQCGIVSDSDHEDWQAGEVHQDENGWVEARVGNMPLVISAPHGGTLQPEAIPDRSCEGITTVRDRNVAELAFEIEKEMVEQHDMRPFVIAAHISRQKIDLNRDIEEPTCGNTTMQETWHKYHEYVETAISLTVEEFGYALFIDLHGHGHDKQRLELGYALTKQKIRDCYYDENVAGDLAEESSLRNLLNMNAELNLQDLLAGEYAFGTLMEAEEISAVPSLDDPYPLKDDPYFTGGYNTRRYTSSDYPKVFGWQIEANYQGVRDDEGRPEFAQVFVPVIMRYIEEHVNERF